MYELITNPINIEVLRPYNIHGFANGEHENASFKFHDLFNKKINFSTESVKNQQFMAICSLQNVNKHLPEIEH